MSSEQQPDGAKKTQPITLTRVVETCKACPSQWDAWSSDGRYMYLRYRFGVGTAEWDEPDGELVARFGADGLDGEISLAEFCERAGLWLVDGAEVKR